MQYIVIKHFTGVEVKCYHFDCPKYLITVVKKML